jgi:hypothetical protein
MVELRKESIFQAAIHFTYLEGKLSEREPHTTLLNRIRLELIFTKGLLDADEILLEHKYSARLRLD